MGAPLLSPSSSLLSKCQREAVAESSRAEVAKKTRHDETVEIAQATGGQDDVSPVSLPGVATSGSGAAPPASSFTSGAAPVTLKDASLQSGVRPQIGVLAASASASGGNICHSTLDHNVDLTPLTFVLDLCICG